MAQSVLATLSRTMMRALIAGAAAVDISPRTPQFLYGYPHVVRMSRGVHDPLYASALYLSDGSSQLLTIACDVIFVDRALARRVRKRIAEATEVPAERTIVTATHTHSGPVTVDMAISAGDPVVPPVDHVYLRKLEDGIVAAAVAAHRQATDVELGLAVADSSCVGSNRHDPRGPSLAEVPVLVLRDRLSKSPIGLMLICAMHPTVLHEDSLQVSGDFPGMTRNYLQSHVLGEGQPVIYHTGVCGNQSPRHITRANTFQEAERLGNLLGKSVADAVATVDYTDWVPLKFAQTKVDLPPRQFPPLAAAHEQVQQAMVRLEKLRRENADARLVRTAECDLFGAEETLTLSQLAESGRLQDTIRTCVPAEISAFSIGSWEFVCWPGEVFVEFALALREHHPDCHFISLAGGELQGYLVTEEAVQLRSYEALNAVFASPAGGEILVKQTLKLLDQM